MHKGDYMFLFEVLDVGGHIIFDPPIGGHIAQILSDLNEPPLPRNMVAYLPLMMLFIKYSQAHQLLKSMNI